MSLEAAIQANTDALKAFTEALLATGIASASAAAAPKQQAAKTAAAASGPVTAKVVEAAAPASTTSESAPAAASAAAAAPASTAAEPITFDQVSRATTEAVKVSREKAVTALAKFGVKRATELKPEQYADYLAALA
jgi:hypothetical protein